jgi:4'-phosphopantetheinyl transferase
VDLQTLTGGIDPERMAQRYFPAGEAAYVAAAGTDEERTLRFVRLWTRKEACLKAAGARLSEGLGLPVGGEGHIVVRDPSGALPGRYAVRDLPATQGFHAAVALTGEEAFIPTQRSFDALAE